MARKTNITGIKTLSIGHTKNSKGGLLTRYSVNYKKDGKPSCKSFYFGANQNQFDAFIKATDFMTENGLLSLSSDEVKTIYKEFKHEKLI